MKKITFLLLTVLLFIQIPLTVYSLSSQSEQRLFDDTGYFDIEETESLNKILLSTENTVGFYVSVLVSDNVGGDKSNSAVVDYTDVFYEDRFGINTNGIIFLINMDTKFDYISTSGSAIQIFSDQDIEDLFDYFWDDMLDENYYDAVVKFCNRVMYHVSLDSQSNNYQKDSEAPRDNYQKDPEIPGDNYYPNQNQINFEGYDNDDLIQSLAVGGLIGLILAVSIIISTLNRYKVKPAKRAERYLDKESISFNQKSDVFIRRYVTTRKIDTDNHGKKGGGGSFHRSSGGGFHGGGGRQR